ncbi:hypothetical protein E2C01_096399 [Portunus trituberculatus]|uniref:Uncharacterized protein n=1 Tax=Portunus trituberculatus TaxID=210409 RepID=A0A5B7K2P0_PORTR|nr:hypothetical protein [Portunus trituberculatus]
MSVSFGVQRGKVNLDVVDTFPWLLRCFIIVLILCEYRADP